MSTLKEYAVIATWTLAFGLIFLISIPVTGLVVSKSWNWFLAPIAGLRQISLTEGLGFSMFLAVIGTIITMPLRRWEAETKPDDSPNRIAIRGLSKMAALGVFGPLAGLAVAWVWHTFIISPPGY